MSVAPPTAPSPKLSWSARLPQIAQKLPPALALLPSVHQPQLRLREESATEVLELVPEVPALALPVKLSACCRVQPLSPTTQWRLALLTAKTLRAPVLQHSHWFCQMAKNVDRQEGLDTAAQAAAALVEVSFFFS